MSVGRFSGARLDRLPLFREVSEHARAELHRLVRCFEADKYERLLLQGATGTDLFMVITGAAVVSRQCQKGEERVVGLLFPGDMFGLMQSGSYVNGVRAAVHGTYARVDRDALARLGDAYPALRHALYRSVVADLDAAQDHLVILGAMSAVERVARALCQLDRRQRKRGSDPGTPVWLPMRRTDLASYLGIELPTLSRVTARLRANHLIAFPSTSEVRLIDRQRLAEIAGCPEEHRDRAGSPPPGRRRPEF